MPHKNMRSSSFSPNPKSSPMPETCNSRTLSWLINPCIPKSPSVQQTQTPIQTRPATSRPGAEPESEPESEPPICSLPDDLLLACLARAPISSLPSAAASCRRFSLLLSSRHFSPLRRSLSPPLVPTLFSLSLSSAGLVAAARPVDAPGPATWQVSSFPLPAPPRSSSPTFVSLDSAVYVISCGSAFRFDTWTARIVPISPPLTPRKKFAAAAANGRIYVAGGSSRTSAVEIYDPESGAWRIAAEGPTRRYGCVGAAAGDTVYAAGGLTDGADARAAGTADAYHAGSGQWAPRGTRSVPGGGCVVGACGVGPSLYVIASNAVEFSFWRWDPQEQWGRRRGRGGARGEWVPLEPPPLRGAGVGLRRAPVRFGCCGVGEGRMAVVAQGGGRGQDGDFGGWIWIYDVGKGEWSNGPELPVGFRRAGLVCVEC